MKKARKETGEITNARNPLRVSMRARRPLRDKFDTLETPTSQPARATSQRICLPGGRTRDDKRVHAGPAGVCAAERRFLTSIRRIFTLAGGIAPSRCSLQLLGRSAPSGHARFW